MPSSTPTQDDQPSLRFIPDDWLGPIPVSTLFDQPNPLEVDLGCGKGRFLLHRAASNPDTNFLGIDRMLQRIRKVDRKGVRMGLANLRLLRIDGYYATVYLLPPCSVRTIYIFFPDPWPKKRHHKNRLFNDLFLDALDRVLLPDGRVHVATDHGPYFQEIEALLTADRRFEGVEPFVPGQDERTDFELIFTGRAEIFRCSVGRSGCS